MTTQRPIYGHIVAPASKSMTQRAVAAAALATGESIIRHPSQCRDATAAIEIANVLGATVTEQKDEWRLAAERRLRASTLPCRESALCARLFAPIAALFPTPVEITGSGTLLRRPMDDVVAALAAFGVLVTAHRHCLPLRIDGALRHGVAVVDASTGSQTLSGLLMALPTLPGDSEIIVNNPVSRPYLDMTLEVMRTFGVEVTHHRHRHFYIKGKQHYRPQTFMVEGDWSSAAFWMAVGAIGGELSIDGLRADSVQADKVMLPLLEQAGARIQWRDDTLTVGRGALRAFRFDASDCPDLFPPLVLLAAFCEGVSAIEGARRLLHKESNRAVALQETFGILGVPISVENDTLVVHGGRVRGGSVSSFHDHRIAMAAACAGLFTEAPVRVDDMDCIQKSYPAFVHDWQAIQRFNNSTIQQ
jgi:3-phosphoshikimate 1-carboxyvinyltransferase